MIRQLLAEALLLAMVGGIAGVLLAQWAETLLLRLVSAEARVSAVQLNLQLDARMLAFTDPLPR